MNEEPIRVFEEWCSIDIENRSTERLFELYQQLSQEVQSNQRKLEEIQAELARQTQSIERLAEEIKGLRNELHLYPVSSNKERMVELLEELRVIKERELNLMIREKIPVPFHPYPTLHAYGMKKKETKL
jgi:septal ring factor EnvC (AmiA/AmiB activator)